MKTHFSLGGFHERLLTIFGFFANRMKLDALRNEKSCYVDRTPT